MKIRESCLYCSRQGGDPQGFNVIASREIITAGQVWSHKFSADPGHIRGMVTVILLVMLERFHFLIRGPLSRFRSWGCPRDRLEGHVPIVLLARPIPTWGNLRNGHAGKKITTRGKGTHAYKYAHLPSRGTKNVSMESCPHLCLGPVPVVAHDADCTRQIRTCKRA